MLYKSAKIIILFILSIGFGISTNGYAQDRAIAKTTNTLQIGDQAPALHAATWLKGERVDAFKSGQVYVVEFWATWCGPCKMAMPHLSALAKQYADDVTFIGFNVKDGPGGGDTSTSYVQHVRDFVTALGDGMAYTVAVDVPAQTTWDTWMTAAGLRGIPATFVIDQTGRIAWMGHPLSGLDLVLEKVVSNSFNAADQKAVEKEIAARQEATTALLLHFYELVAAEKTTEALAAGEQLLDDYAMGKSVTLASCYTLLLKENPEQAKHYIEEKITKYANDPITLGALARQLTKLEDDQSKAIAVKAMSEVIKRTAKSDFSVRSVLAEVAFNAGMASDAVKWQQQVVEILSGETEAKQKEQLLATAKENLRTYKAATTTLNVGDPAPKLSYTKWHKGDPVDQFEPGHVYVVEFWATWCGPCKMAMPHLSELANTYKGKATFIGFNVRENLNNTDDYAPYITKVDQFVNRIGKGMDYSVAMDVAEGTTWSDWMTAAGLRGIPSSFVIDQTGKIVWIGHPFAGLDLVVKQVLEGNFDEEALDNVNAQVEERNKHLENLRNRFSEMRKEGNDAEAFKASKAYLEQTLMGKFVFMGSCFDILSKTSQKKAHKFALETMETYANDPLSLQGFAQYISQRENKSDKKLAVKIMEKAFVRFLPDDTFAHKNMASIYYQAGEIKKAIKTQTQLLAILSDPAQPQQNEAAITAAQADLEKFKAAL